MDEVDGMSSGDRGGVSELVSIMEQNKFKNCSYRNLSGGIVSIHSGWKI